jgi:hypothetical protein
VCVQTFLRPLLLDRYCSSWTGTAILRLLRFLAPLGSLPWMSYMAPLRPYCHHQR